MRVRMAVRWGAHLERSMVSEMLGEEECLMSARDSMPYFASVEYGEWEARGRLARGGLSAVLLIDCEVDDETATSND